MADSLENWMSNIKDDILFKHIVIPASHDAGMVKSFLSKKNLSKDNYSTQLLTVGEQLAHGSRQLDLRISKDNGVHKAYHGGSETGGIQGAVNLRAYGQPWDEICDELAEFITSNPSEFVILKLDKQKKYTTDMMRYLLHAVNKAGGGPLPPLSLGNNLDLSESNIGKLRGRLYICGNSAAINDWEKVVPKNHARLIIGQWEKAKKAYSGVETTDHCIGRFRYVLIGDSLNSVDPRKSGEALKNGLKLKVFYLTADKKELGKRKVGMRGIWFNNISLVADIKKFSDSATWATNKLSNREAVWLSPGPGLQNVASLDFIDVDKSTYIISKNPSRNWSGGRPPKWMSLI
jgi:hypothetical protein